MIRVHALGHLAAVDPERDPEEDANAQARDQVLGVLLTGRFEELDRDEGHRRGDGRR
jgi:hypothetical protein